MLLLHVLFLNLVQRLRCVTEIVKMDSNESVSELFHLHGSDVTEHFEFPAYSGFADLGWNEG
ncbi:hypothetical protein HanRHA438_Chr16g0737671 [Helianthus annuus]|nr:hypothetical protein HanRHA438_Chr16g0737671 [Helianthus annuus]